MSTGKLYKKPRNGRVVHASPALQSHKTSSEHSYNCPVTKKRKINRKNPKYISIGTQVNRQHFNLSIGTSTQIDKEMRNIGSQTVAISSLKTMEMLKKSGKLHEPIEPKRKLSQNIGTQIDSIAINVNQTTHTEEYKSMAKPTLLQNLQNQPQHVRDKLNEISGLKWQLITKMLTLEPKDNHILKLIETLMLVSDGFKELRGNEDGAQNFSENVVENLPEFGRLSLNFLADQMKMNTIDFWDCKFN